MNRRQPAISVVRITVMEIEIAQYGIASFMLIAVQKEFPG
jgi:hypothetical protein